MRDIPLDAIPLLGLLSLLPVAAFVLGRSTYVVLAAVSVVVTVLSLRLMFAPAGARLDDVLADDEAEGLHSDPLWSESD